MTAVGLGVALAICFASAIERVVSLWGGLDILVNNAGVEPRHGLLDMDEWDWKRTLDVNLSGPFFLIQAGGRVMGQQGGGVIGRDRIGKIQVVEGMTVLLQVRLKAALPFAPIVGLHAGHDLGRSCLACNQIAFDIRLSCGAALFNNLLQHVSCLNGSIS